LGCFSVRQDEEPCLVFEALTEHRRLTSSPKVSLVHAARWIGGLHERSSAWRSDKVPGRAGVFEYDEEYFAGWAQRTLRFTESLVGEYPWLPEVSELFMRDAHELADKGNYVLVHGEYYPANILVRDDEVIPVDWQSAAFGPGMVDLASLTEGWGRGALVKEALRAYWAERKCDRFPAAFQRQLQLARVYWPLRWLGDEPWATLHPRRKWYFAHLYEEARQLWGIG
jgi:aminoglycoside phosphotransferase (APT) family kinase protein